MSYLSLISNPEERERKTEQLSFVSGIKFDLFKSLNLKRQSNLLQDETNKKLEKLSKDRKELYVKLYEQFKKTIKVIDMNEVVKTLEIPNNNEIYFVPLFDNQLGENHYASVYLDLILDNEVNGNIIPGKTKLFETSSGSGGIACSRVAKELGYPCVIAIPDGGEKARENAIKNNGAELMLTDKDQYTNGFPDFVKRYYFSRENVPNIRNKDIFFLSHSQGKPNKATNTFENNEIAIKALAKIGYEILQNFQNNGKKVDYVISGIGNGTNTLGISGPLHLHGSKIIGFETFEGANMYERKFPGKYKEEYGIDPGELGRHSMPGLSPSGNKIYFPHFENSVDMVNDVYLVASKKVDENYEKSTGRKLEEKNIVYFDQEKYDLSDRGRTTKAGFYVAMKQAGNINDSTIVVFGYDKSNRYDDFQKNYK